MMNYYDELEVSKTASKEVIEKVYKVLAKKYHPDTTKELNRQAAEEKFKIISEAYEILSDDEKRKKYDLELEQSNPSISYEEYMNVVHQRDYYSTSLKNLQNQINQFNNSNMNYYNVNNQTQYNQGNSNFNNMYNNFYKSSMNTNPNVNSKNKTYYYTDTGKPASAFDYFKYRIKELFSDLFFFILIIFLLILITKFISSSSFHKLFFK